MDTSIYTRVAIQEWEVGNIIARRTQTTAILIASQAPIVALVAIESNAVLGCWTVNPA